MTPSEAADQLFQWATGWLGWTPEVALDTNVPQILLAMKGRVDFLTKTNPWGSGKTEPIPTLPRPPRRGPVMPQREDAASDLKDFMASRPQFRLVKG